MVITDQLEKEVAWVRRRSSDIFLTWIFFSYQWAPSSASGRKFSCFVHIFPRGSRLHWKLGSFGRSYWHPPWIHPCLCTYKKYFDKVSFHNDNDNIQYLHSIIELLSDGRNVHGNLDNLLVCWELLGVDWSQERPGVLVTRQLWQYCLTYRDIFVNFADWSLVSFFLVVCSLGVRDLFFSLLNSVAAVQTIVGVLWCFILFCCAEYLTGSFKLFLRSLSIAPRTAPLSPRSLQQENLNKIFNPELLKGKQIIQLFEDLWPGPKSHYFKGWSSLTII